MVETVSDGIRSNGPSGGAKKSGVILAVGDSFTFGDEVADHETWPAYLESTTDYQVLNAGVSSYALDQMILRAEFLNKKYHPDILIVSLIYESISRCGQKARHGVPKPYFDIENDRLILRNQPVPIKEAGRLDVFRRIFGYSYLAHKIMGVYFPEYWWKDSMREMKRAGNDPYKVAQKLLNRLSDMSREENVRVILLVQSGMNVSERHIADIEKLLKESLMDAGGNIDVVSLAPYFYQLKIKDREAFERLFIQESGSHHMSPAGNALVAGRIKEAL